MLMRWNERAMPSRTIFCGGRPTRSRPSNDTEPRSGLRWPVMRLKKVVLPAPLGPITAWVSPASRSNDTSRVATKPAKAFHSPAMVRSMVLMSAATPSGTP